MENQLESPMDNAATRYGESPLERPNGIGVFLRLSGFQTTRLNGWVGCPLQPTRGSNPRSLNFPDQVGMSWPVRDSKWSAEVIVGVTAGRRDSGSL